MLSKSSKQDQNMLNNPKRKQSATSDPQKPKINTNELAKFTESIQYIKNV